MNFFFEVLIGGLLSGVMYALVALGFVMIYKASGVFNFAQGAMVYLAALSVVGCMEKGAPLWLAIILAFAIMTAFGIATEKFVLRKLVKSGATTVVRAQGSVTPLAQDDRPSKDATDTQVGASVAMRQWESLYSMAQHFAISEANFKAIRADLKEYSTGMVKAKATRAARK